MDLSGFHPADPARPGAGIFGLPHGRTEARIVLLPVPFDATTSYRSGTAAGPRAIFDASKQVDLFDRQLGRVYERGIYLEAESEGTRRWNEEASALSRPLIREGGGDRNEPRQAEALTRIDALSRAVNDSVYDHTATVLAERKVPGTIGGEHSVSFGAIRAAAEQYPGLGILHLDAHMDFRPAYEGFTYSHASIMYNVMREIDPVGKLVQIGIRDMSEEEIEFGQTQGARVTTHFDDVWAERLLRGEAFETLARPALKELPETVYLSFDIDVLEPALCPHTGTPVPGGLTFTQATRILSLLRESGRRVVGFDLVEVAPGAAGEPELDANVGARVLYKLCGTVTV
jgi:agmatinase